MVPRAPTEDIVVKHQSKMIVTLSMVWIGIMALASHPEWIRAALGFVTEATHGGAGGSGTSGATVGPAPSGGGGGGAGGFWKTITDPITGKNSIQWVPQ